MATDAWEVVTERLIRETGFRAGDLRRAVGEARDRGNLTPLEVQACILEAQSIRMPLDATMARIQEIAETSPEQIEAWRARVVALAGPDYIGEEPCTSRHPDWDVGCGKVAGHESPRHEWKVRVREQRGFNDLPGLRPTFVVSWEG